MILVTKKLYKMYDYEYIFLLVAKHHNMYIKGVKLIKMYCFRSKHER